MPTRILVFGTFDIIHAGHLDFFKQARSLAIDSFLMVSVARDANVKKIKGKKPSHGEKLRLAEIGRCYLVDKAVLGAPKDYIGHIARLKPDIIALGYDQNAYTVDLKEKLEACGIKVKIKRLKPYKPEKYKTSLLISS